jgi:hypothetical protein
MGQGVGVSTEGGGQVAQIEVVGHWALFIPSSFFCECCIYTLCIFIYEDQQGSDLAGLEYCTM